MKRNHNLITRFKRVRLSGENGSLLEGNMVGNGGKMRQLQVAAHEVGGERSC